MSKLLYLAAASAIALSFCATASTTQANNAQAKVNFCHFPGHAPNDDLPLIYPKTDHFISDNHPTHDAATCNERGGKVIRIGCSAIKGHVPDAPHHFIDQFCDFIR